ncbi:MAG TPA: response regulator, partial [Pirellulales bacterium]|nr:response regulator [Pirellulales bacterium]
REASLAKSNRVAPRRILLAEDSPINQKVALGILKRRGHHVDVADNGRDALACLDQRRYDVVLMDMQMPEMDGLHATAEIRRREQQTGAHVPVIAMTANAMKGDRERCLDAGMDDYLSKPISADALLAMVEHFEPSECSDDGHPPTDEISPTFHAEDCMPTDTEVFDYSAALQRFRNDREMLHELVAIFLEHCPTFMQQIVTAIADGDAVALERAAHTLRGSADAIAGRGVSQAAWQLEQLARDHATDFDAAIDDLREEVDRLTSVLSEMQPSTLVPASR